MLILFRRYQLSADFLVLKVKLIQAEYFQLNENTNYNFNFIQPHEEQKTSKFKKALKNENVVNYSNDSIFDLDFDGSSS